MTVAQVTVLPNTCCAAAWAILVSPSPVPDWGLFILSLTSFSNTLLCPHWPSPMSMKHLEHGFILEVSKRFQVQTQSVLIYGKSPAMVVSPSNTILLSLSWKKGKRNFAHHENSLWYGWQNRDPKLSDYAKALAEWHEMRQALHISSYNLELKIHLWIAWTHSANIYWVLIISGNV